MDYLLQIGTYWFWFGLAALLLLIELVHGRFVFMAISFASLLVGVLSSLFAYLSVLLQVIIFIILAVGFVWISLYHERERQAKILRYQDVVKHRHYVGHLITLESPIENGNARLDINGIVWMLRGEDCPAGRQVKVVDMGEGWLEVEAVA